MEAAYCLKIGARAARWLVVALLAFPQPASASAVAAAAAAAPPPPQTARGYWASAGAAAATPPEILEAIRAAPWRGGLEPASEVLTPTEAVVTQGAIPPGLRGTVFRQGPGRIRVGASKYGHWFDGDGLTSAVSLDGSTGQVRMMSRYVRTPRYEAQQRQPALAQALVGGGMAMRGAWTDAKQGSLLDNIFQKPTNPANTNIAVVTDPETGQALLLALCEGGRPFSMNPNTLETLGEWDFGGALGPDGFFSAHPKVDLKTGSVFAIGLAIGVLTSSLVALRVFRLDPSVAGKTVGVLSMTATKTVALDSLAFVHDISITERYIVIVIPPWEVEAPSGVIASLLIGPLAKRFSWNAARGARVVVLDRITLDVIADVETDPSAGDLSFYHVVNAFDNDDDGDSLMLHIAAHNGPREAVESAFGDMYAAAWDDSMRCSMRELSVEGLRRRGEATARLISGTIQPNASAFELPAIHPAVVGQQYRHVFTNAAVPQADTTPSGRDGHGLLRNAPFLNAIERLDLIDGSIDRITFGFHRFAGEPMIVPKAPNSSPSEVTEETDAWCCTFVYDSDDHASDLVILDAANLAAGPVATIRLPAFLPYSFHGCWSETAFLLD
mmetsp:Transcript_4689/g.17698  ORF Transcript_4689/g.17698 Transcript_4689/m.17698 type:complete len:612 (+) Transcript_4689:66-1901(+)|eukprot:CAMPEP_0203908264 /NCGR_PEP_ID=MMETSP0359-20131031/49680_1 /ASSEMBLY_ACC=CAM_ASM_000338 /TAXON_ID=268821 /ORGANISM="Scrippsiella Hangoei, Strain SHTV-5" /LENGTH=611 /DNA_ID=CAMNT_0050833229 /DNA_START=27 /DNA_END=1862 /DNA_ORIENTATION=+